MHYLVRIKEQQDLFISINCEDESSQRRGGAQQAGVRGRVKNPAELFFYRSETL